MVASPAAGGLEASDRIDVASAARLVTAQKTFAKNLLAAALPRSKPLLKFDTGSNGDEEPYLHPEGLELLRPLKRIHPIAFIGDGRAGKSFLASHVLGTEAFFSDDASSAVTTGIDVAVAPLDKVVRQVARLCPESQLQDLEEASKDESLKDEHVVIFDCEGGNNALAEVRRLVDVFALAVCTHVVFVSHSMATEASLQNIAAAMAAMEIIKFSPEMGVRTAKRLSYVVNQTTLKYSSDHFEKILSAGGGDDAARSELREAITDTFEQRGFFPVPYSTLSDFKEQLGNFMLSLVLHRAPLMVDDVYVSGQQMGSILEVVVEEVGKVGHIGGPQVARVVLLDGFLTPLRLRLSDQAKAGTDSPSSYDKDFVSKDPRPETLATFRQAAQGVKQPLLVAEAEAHLSADLDSWWNALCEQNEALGEHVLEVASEKRVIVEDAGNERLGGTSLLSKLTVSVEICHDEERQVVRLHNGSVVPSTEWTSGPRYTKWREGDVHLLRRELAALPKLKGQISLLAFGFLGFTRLVPCFCVAQDLHLIWYDDAAIFTKAGASEDVDAAGIINLLKYSNVAVQAEGDTGFSITMTTRAASVEDQREVVRQFDVRQEQMYAGLACCTTARPKGTRGQGTPKHRDEWVACLQAQAALAGKYRSLLADSKVIAPSLTDFLGNSRSIHSLQVPAPLGAPVPVG